MAEMTCANEECGSAIQAGDQFCGICGRPTVPLPRPEDVIPWSPDRAGGTNGNGSSRRTGQGNGTSPHPPAGGGVSGRPNTDPPGQEPPRLPFFSHEPPRRAGSPNSVTRFLCAAAYLDRGFAHTVIFNLLMTRRAVAPSVNFDVGPVLRHCLRARRHILIRDIVLLVIIVTGLVIKTLPTLDVLLFMFVLGSALPNVWRSRSGWGRRLAYLLAALIAGGLAVLFAAVLVLESVASSVFSGDILAASPMAGIVSLAVTFAVLVGALTATEFAYLRTTARAVIGDSRQESKPPGNLSRAAQQRMAIVEGAQWGNVTLHGGWFPFIGAGKQSQAHWSIATALRTTAPGDQGPNSRYVRIDPVELHNHIGSRLRALNDYGLPYNERITALTVSDRLVGTGRLPAGNPLFDGFLRTPYSHASREAVEALMRHPQANLRYYQQVSVNDESPVVMSHGEKVIDEVDQEVAVSAFVYAAVEGRMLYLQFVLTALPPIDAMYRFPRTDYAVSTPKTLIATLKRLSPLIWSAGPEIYRTSRHWSIEKRYLSQSNTDYGARISVRELGTDTAFSRYMQQLDVEKYNMILSQVLLNAVTDYLTSKKIDISAFTGIAQNIINNINTGTVYGDLNQQAGNNNNISKPPNSGPGS